MTLYRKKGAEWIEGATPDADFAHSFTLAGIKEEIAARGYAGSESPLLGIIDALRLRLAEHTPEFSEMG